ncbi:MAG: hypothetical protein AAF065_15410 [Verrucomicrobiota bacterium]
MIKKILIAIVVLALIAGAFVYFLGSSALNKGIKHGVETFGPKVTQTSVTLDEVNLSVLSGSGTLKGLVVGNPEGFKSENIFELGQIDIEVDTSSVLSDTIVIEKIHIIEPGISYEKMITSSNVKELQKNIEAFTGPQEDKPETVEEESGSSKKLVIKELVIDGGTIYVGVLGVGQTVPLPRIEMTNIGAEGTETNAADVINEILTKVLTSIGPAIAGATDLGKDAANVLKTQGLEKTGQAVDAVGEGIKNLFGK